MRFNSILSLAAMLAAPALVSAQTVTVNKAGGPGVFTTISDALASFNQPEDTSPGDTVPNVVQVTDAGIYEEIITIATPVTLEATGAEKATIELLPNPNGFYEFTGGNRHGYGGIFINLPATMTTGTVKIKNLNLLPSMNSTLDTRLKSVVENGNNNLYLELDNVLITANDNHKPLNDDPTSSSITKIFPGARVGTTEPPVYTYPVGYDPTVVQFGGHGIVLGRAYFPGAVEGDGVELLFNNSVIHTLRNDYYVAATEPERTPTGIVMHGATDPTKPRITHIEGESGISFCRAGVSIFGDLRMESAGARIQMRGHANQAIRLDGPGQNERVINDSIITDNSNTAIYDRGFGTIRFSMKHCLSYMTLHHIILVDNPTGTDAAAGTILIEDSTLVGGRATASSNHTIRFGIDTETDLIIRNSILAGKNSQPNATNVISLPGYNDVTVEGSAIVTTGTNAFRNLPFSRGTNATHPDTSTFMTEDPAFVGITGTWNPASPDFLDVRNNAFVDKGIAGSPLGGGADYVGGLASNVSEWHLY